MKWIAIFLFFLSGIDSISQCGINSVYTITDQDNGQPDTTNVTIIVEGAVNNNLAMPLQGVCGVQLKFRHPFVQELVIELISPAGQKITLVGGDNVTSNTSLITWDVTFVPCSATAAPDPGFDDVWENNQGWQNLTTYKGQYYPHEGCLENFNIGLVNGTWTLRCIDIDDEGQGALLSAQLIFCQDQGISCSECKLNAGSINNPDLSTCRGDQSLSFNIDKTFPPNTYNPTIYNYNNVIFKDSLIVAYQVVPDLTNFLAGAYKICGIQYAKVQSNVLPVTGTHYNRDRLANHWFVSGYCAAVSDSCMTVHINDSTMPVDVVKYICIGDSVLIDHKYYSEEGIYNIAIKNGTCDSLVKLDLRVLKIKAEIKTENDTIGCTGDFKTLYGANAGDDVQNLVYSWFTFDGKIEGSNQDMDVIISKKGRYYLELTALTPELVCIDTALIEIFQQNAAPDIVLRSDTLSCKSDTASVFLNLSGNINTSEWTSREGFAFDVIQGGIRVWNAGFYTVKVTTDGGCFITDSIYVGRILDFQPPVITAEILNCIKDSVQINVLPADGGEYAFLWTGVAPYYERAQNPYVKQLGHYNVLMTNIKSGCTNSFDILVGEDKKSPVIIEIIFDTLNCARNSTAPMVKADQPVSDYIWSGQGFNSNLSSPQIFNAGYYQVRITSAVNGCTGEATFDVVKDTIRPVLTILAHEELTCLASRIVLQASTNALNSNEIIWKPTNFQGEALTVTSPGVYIAELKGANQCIGRDTTIVTENKILPTFNATSSIINCKNVLSKVKIAPTSDYEKVIWENGINPISIQDNELEFNTSFDGTFYFSVVNNSGCITNGEIKVIKDTLPPAIIQFIKDTLDCDKLKVDIGVIADKPVIEYLWNGPGVNDFIGSNLLTVSISGDYYLKVTGENFCSRGVLINVPKSLQSPEFTVFTDTITCIKAKGLIGVSPISEIESYKWLGPANFTSIIRTPEVSIPGSYTVSVTGSNGCITTTEVIVFGDIKSPDILVADTFAIPCGVESVDLFLSSNEGIAGYFWVFPSGDTINDERTSASEAGRYGIYVLGKNGCYSGLKYFQVIKSIPDFKLSVATDTITCLKTEAVLEVSSNIPTLTYQWFSPSGQTYKGRRVLTTQAGTFELKVSDEKNCVDSLQVVVLSDTQVAKIEIETSGTLQCENRKVIIDPRNTGIGNQYIAFWKTDDGYIAAFRENNIIEVDREGHYIFVIENLRNGCISDTTVYITETPQQFSDFALTATDPICREVDNGSIILDGFNGNSPYKVIVNGANKGGQTAYYNLPAGRYIIEVSDALGCKLIKETELNSANELSFSIGDVFQISFGDSLLLKPDFSGDPTAEANLKWFLKDSLICMSCTQLWVRPFINTIYEIEYSVNGYCKKRKSVLVKVNNNIENSIPNIFAPGSLSGNNIFYLPQIRGIKAINQVLIFDKWAENVYKVNNLIPGRPENGWDGTFNGRALQPGVYVLFVELVLEDGTLWKYKGDVTIIR
jgi:hypothetical protein